MPTAATARRVVLAVTLIALLGCFGVEATHRGCYLLADTQAGIVPAPDASIATKVPLQDALGRVGRRLLGKGPAKKKEMHHFSTLMKVSS